ncbi:SoxR reducing system RseC family protein [Sedimentibacter sp. B4]|uniref:SoxR reducing system RseC family protein n=1 Tax=Sedimentibacter sp. B4 TaxID=304766 RepID=UPI000310B711|nr:SoxR reducing system RseC family protein [Sedimentibacter sp. B4]
MALIGKIEKKKGTTATIYIKKVLPCGDNCRNCSAGCKHYSTRIEKHVEDNVKEGDYVEIIAEGEVTAKSSAMLYALSASLVVTSVVVVQLLPGLKNKEGFSALAVIVSLIAAQLFIKLNDKHKMQKNSEKFKIGKRINEK